MRPLRCPNSGMGLDILRTHILSETSYYTHPRYRPRELVNLFINSQSTPPSPPTSPTRPPVPPSTSRTSSWPTIPRTSVTRSITTMMTPWSLVNHDHWWCHPESWTAHTHTHTHPHSHRANDDRPTTRDDDRLVATGDAETLIKFGS